MDSKFRTYITLFFLDPLSLPLWPYSHLQAVISNLVSYCVFSYCKVCYWTLPRLPLQISWFVPNTQL